MGILIVLGSCQPLSGMSLNPLKRVMGILMVLMAQQHAHAGGESQSPKAGHGYSNRVHACSLRVYVYGLNPLKRVMGILMVSQNLFGQGL